MDDDWCVYKVRFKQPRSANDTRYDDITIIRQWWLVPATTKKCFSRTIYSLMFSNCLIMVRFVVDPYSYHILRMLNK